MIFTGERMIPECNINQEMYIEHLARYKFAMQFCRFKKVLDIACGAGYGTHMLASVAQFVRGVDISADAISYAQNKYKTSNNEFVLGSVANIPAENESFDVIISFETLEHVDGDTQCAFLAEVTRVLKPDGLFLVSTPNAETSPEGNEFHLKELTRPELNEFLLKKFHTVTFWHQKNVEASLIVKESRFESLELGPVEIDRLWPERLETSYFILATCTNRSHSDLNASDMVEIGSDKLRNALYEEKGRLEQLIVAKDDLILKSENLVRAKDALIHEFEMTISERGRLIRKSSVSQLAKKLNPFKKKRNP